MFNDLPIQFEYAEMERNAYNSAFYELGFRWYWDRATYEELALRGQSSEQRIAHYLSTAQPHLLKAYDAEFLIQAILAKKSEYLRACGKPLSGYFNWAETRGCELGA